jgi:serine/threonine protein kinase
MTTPNPKYFCPRCRAAFDSDSNYCGRCGADMHRASRLQRALLLDEDSSTSNRALRAPGDDGRPTLDESSVSDGGRPPRERRGSISHDVWLGKVVDGRYRVLDVLGRGGMGVVYKIEHQRMGKIAAMKVLHRDLARDKEVIGRFRREAEAVSQLTHPNTVQVFDFGTAQGALYLVMEYVRGLDIGSLIDRDGPMPFQRAAPLFAQVCAALTEAHELGIVHRDLKPENILVTRTPSGQDFVKVLDFGLAKLAEREELSEVTGRGQIVGTPYYMSPEQIRGENEVDGRSDIYSLGALMYKVLTGEHAFSAASPVGVLTKHLTEPVTPPSRRSGKQVVPEVDAIVLRAMEKRPDQRYESVREMLGALETVYAEQHEHSTSKQRVIRRAVTAAEPDYGVESERRLRRADLDAFERSLRRRRYLWVVMMPLLIASMAAGGLYYWKWRQEQPRSAEEESNDEPAAATPIGSGQPVSGQIGQRVSVSQADRDYYRLVEVPAPGGGEQLSVTVTPLPNVDLVLVLLDSSEQVVTHRDDGGVGQPERLRNLRVRSPVLLMVTEARLPTSTSLPTENVSDSYELTATLSPSSDSSEVEPNDSASDAGAVGPGARVGGWLERRDDVDLYRYAGAAGRHRVSVRGADAVPIEWRHGSRVLAGREQELDLAPGDLIQIGRSDGGAPRDKPLPGADERYELVIAE